MIICIFNSRKCILQILGILFLVSIFACKKKSYNCNKICNNSQELVFSTDFSNTKLSQITNDWYSLSDIDTAINVAYSWEAFENHDCIGDIKINYGNGSESQRWARIVQDPTDSLNNVLSFKIIEPNDKEPGTKKGRVQLDVNGNNCIKEYAQTVKLFLHKDMQELTEWNESFYWLSIFEFWNNANWTHEKYPFRITVNIAKPNKDVGSALYFQAKADIYKGFGRWEDVWNEVCTDIEIPFNTWIEIELYILEGNSQNGIFQMSITLENQEQKKLFSIQNFTHHPKETCPDGFSHIHPLKFYTSEELVQYMNQNNKNLQIYWDDWNVWRNTKPLEFYR